MKIDYCWLFYVVLSIASYASFRAYYWRKRALHTEECLAITKVIRARKGLPC